MTVQTPFKVLPIKNVLACSPHVLVLKRELTFKARNHKTDRAK